VVALLIQQAFRKRRCSDELLAKSPRMITADDSISPRNRFWNVPQYFKSKKVTNCLDNFLVIKAGMNGK